MENIGKKWTKAQDKVLLKEIKKSPENLKKAFTRASEKLGRTTNACTFRWYSKVSKMYDKDVNAVCFAIFSKNKYSVNRKNVKKDVPTEQKTSLWTRIINFIKGA